MAMNVRGRHTVVVNALVRTDILAPNQNPATAQYSAMPIACQLR